jgi:hypothetical protein
MLGIERTAPADREPDPVQREGIALADGGEVVMRRPSLAHIVLGVDLEPADVGRAFEDVPIVLRLEADASAEWERALAS